MPSLSDLLELARATAEGGAARLLDGVSGDQRKYVHDRENPREVKAVADELLNRHILQALASTGLPVLSEESGFVPGRGRSKYWFIVDPLDGTFNYVRGLGPSAISIALWEDQQPIFGVIYNLTDRQLVWGGSGLGAYCGNNPIAVSKTSKKAEAAICTGFPTRFEVADDHAKRTFWNLIEPFAKVRMLGSAAVSLLHVANGSADAYSEHHIMLWDVAAGLAVVQGAGGGFIMTGADREWSYTVYASNGHLHA